MNRCRSCSALILALFGAYAHAQTARQVEINSGWGGLGTPQSVKVVIKRNGAEYRLNGKRVDAALIANLVAALKEPPISKPDSKNLGITKQWCRDNAAKLGVSVGVEFEEGAPNQKRLFIQ